MCTFVQVTFKLDTVQRRWPFLNHNGLGLFSSCPEYQINIYIISKKKDYGKNSNSGAPPKLLLDIACPSPSHHVWGSPGTSFSSKRKESHLFWQRLIIGIILFYNLNISSELPIYICNLIQSTFTTMLGIKIVNINIANINFPQCSSQKILPTEI